VDFKISVNLPKCYLPFSQLYVDTLCFTCYRNALNVVKDDLIARLDELIRYSVSILCLHHAVVARVVCQM
jgi:hypothetical protein